MALLEHLPNHPQKLADVALALRELHPVRESDAHLGDAEATVRGSVHHKRDEPSGLTLTLVCLLEDAVLFLATPGILKELAVVIALLLTEFLHRTAFAVLAVILQRKCVVDCWILIHF